MVSKPKSVSEKPLWAAVFFAVSASVFMLIIFIKPIVGVADQGDFSRVFFGIEWPDPENFWNSGHFFKYVVPDYNFTVFPHMRLFGIPPAVSQIYFVYAGRLLSRIVGLDHFSQYVYAVFIGLTYTLGLTLIYAAVMPENLWRRTLLGLGMITVFLDGRYVQWFNSLYGEPIVMTGMLLVIGLFLLMCKLITHRSETRAIIACGVLYGFSQIIMTAGKSQAIVLLVMSFTLNGYIAFLIRKHAVQKTLLLSLLSAAAVIQVIYCIGVYKSPELKPTIKDTLFQTVFNGLLLNADDPAQIIEDWGLDPMFINEVGKSAYAPADFYTFGSIDGELMQKEFFDKVSSFTVIRYYLTHPKDLYNGLIYLGHMSLKVPNNGIHPQGYEVATEHNRFTLWTNFRQSLPKSLYFLSAVLLVAAAVSVALFRRGKTAYGILLCSLMAGGCVQFPMPYIFNGMNDTAKQLMIFDFIFDIIAFAVIAFVINEAVKIVSRRFSRGRPR